MRVGVLWALYLVPNPQSIPKHQVVFGAAPAATSLNISINTGALVRLVPNSLAITEDGSKDRFHGECYAFAEALSVITGWKPVIVFGFLNPTGDEGPFWGGIHGVVKHPDGFYIDASGKVDKKILAKRYAMDYVEFERVSLVRMRNQGGHPDYVVADARADILAYAAAGDLIFSAIPNPKYTWKTHA